MKRFQAIWILIILGCFLASKPTAADKTAEYKIKASYVYNFTKFVVWADDGLPDFNVCILGVDPFGDSINSIEQRMAAGKAIRLQRYPSFTKFFNDANKPHCHLIFVSPAIGNPLYVKNVTNTLVVGEKEGFASMGGMIGFISKHNTIKLQVNLDAVKRGGLKISAKLLEIAEMVRGGDND
jgi:hypothetical protein